jgi:DNA polymerase-3 subunit delta'
MTIRVATSLLPTPAYRATQELQEEIRATAAKTKPQSTIKKINAIMDARTNLSHNAAPLLTVEALICVLAR